MHDQLNILRKIAMRAAGEVSKTRPHEVHSKDQNDFVTDLDRRLEKQIFEDLANAFPKIAALGEESVGESESLPDDCFIVDPLDGTSNFIAGLPFCGVSIARIINGETVLAVVADCYQSQIYAAAKNAGAFCNDTRLQTFPDPQKLFGCSTGLLHRTFGQSQVFENLLPFGTLSGGKRGIEFHSINRSQTLG
jgi:myo-inositol-1(or 4)-monophosphatase